MKLTEKRKVRGYKIRDTPYLKAMRRAKKERRTVAELIEYFVMAYAKGDETTITEAVSKTAERKIS